MTKTIDQWAAEACGVQWIVNRDGWFLYPVNHAITEDVYSVKWTIKDPRCREIVREHFELNTQFRPALPKARVFCYSAKFDVSEAGKTIKESECNCITAIFEAQK